MNPKELLEHLSSARSAGALEQPIAALTADSRNVEAGTLFFALRGVKVDGHDFIDAALEKGALGIVAETDVPTDFHGTWIQVKNSRKALGEASAAFYGFPSHDLKVSGVTGTNGKTTTASIVQYLVATAKGRCGFLGTIRFDLGNDEIQTATHTTPDSIELQKMLDAMRGNGCAGVAMEVSSHALDQDRTAGIEFDSAIFTNLTQDHLDYHRSMDAYFAAKAKFFEHVSEQRVKTKPVMIINADDPAGKKLAEIYKDKANVVTYGMSYGSDFLISDITNTIAQSSFKLEVKGRSFIVRIPLIGRFNIFNAVAALASVNSMGFNLRETINNLAGVPQVPGRLQSVGRQKNFRVFVDYAHTPDALENVLKTLRGLNPRRIITVFGCGGDRDATKRPLMGSVAEQLSHRVIVTSDNPRSEDPDKIINDILKGFGGVAYEKEPDREKAIALAIQIARDGDIILLAGKGHETYQILAEKTIDFDDVKITERYLRDKKIAADSE